MFWTLCASLLWSSLFEFFTNWMPPHLRNRLPRPFSHVTMNRNDGGPHCRNAYQTRFHFEGSRKYTWLESRDKSGTSEKTRFKRRLLLLSFFSFLVCCRSVCLLTQDAIRKCVTSLRTNTQSFWPRMEELVLRDWMMAMWNTWPRLSMQWRKANRSPSMRNQYVWTMKECDEIVEWRM